MAKIGQGCRWQLLVGMMLLCLQVSVAQVYYQAPLATLQPVSPSNKVILANGDDLSESILNAYNKQCKKQQIAVRDSVFVVFETNGEGEVESILQRGGFIQTYIDILTKHIVKSAFKNVGIHKMALVFKLNTNDPSYSIWDVDHVPHLTSCDRLVTDGNDVYYRSCFNYAAEDRIRDLPEPSPKKKDVIRGKIKARVIISPKGEVSGIQFDTACSNPQANDYFMYQLYFVQFPKGVRHNNNEVSYYLDVDMGYFLEEERLKNKRDTTLGYELSAIMYYHKTGKTSLLNKLDLDTAVQKLAGLNDFQVNDDMFELWPRTEQVILGPHIILNVSIPGNLIYSGVALLTPTYFKNRNLDAFPASFTGCAQNYADAEYASTCTSQKLIEHMQTNFSFMRWVDTWPGKICTQVLLFDEEGKLIRQQVVNGTYYAQFDLECLAAMANLPQHEPARLNGNNIPYAVTITAIFR